MDKDVIQHAAAEFIGAKEDVKIEALGNGLINHTYKVVDGSTGKKTMLQAINTNVFTQPADVTGNYNEMYVYLGRRHGQANIPTPLQTPTGSLLYKDAQHNYWRANSFIENSYSPMNAVTEAAAYTVAKSFAAFTKSLAGLDVQQLKATIPNFHDLSFRYQQFEQALQQAPDDRLMKATHIISELKQRNKLVAFYDAIRDSPDYPYRAMHHDCKISNILFDVATDHVICPVDLDTTMPGKYFSDIGDMIRTMTCSVDENSVDWEGLVVRPSFYEAILKGYLEEAGAIFTDAEKKNIHYAGLLLTYMQTLRFTSDFLNGDIYYKTSYAGQNLNRSLNQLLLLEKLEAYLADAYAFSPY